MRRELWGTAQGGVAIQRSEAPLTQPGGQSLNLPQAAISSSLVLCREWDLAFQTFQFAKSLS